MLTVNDYLTSRSLPPEVSPEWNLRIGSFERWPKLENRLVIPLYSYTGRLLAEAGRATQPDHQPKYWFTPTFDRNRWIYGLWKKPISDIPVIVEGYLDVWALRLLGYSAYAVMGSAITHWQAMHIAGLASKVIVYPHLDSTGLQWKHTLDSFGVDVAIPRNPYPFDAPSKDRGDDETADPHWLYVNARSWLEQNLTACRSALQKPTLEDLLK